MAKVANTTGQLRQLVTLAARKHVAPDVAALIAVAAVDLIVDLYGGRRIFVPMYQARFAARREAIVAALREGAVPARVAKQHGIKLGDVLRIAAAALASGQAETAGR